MITNTRVIGEKFQNFILMYLTLYEVLRAARKASARCVYHPLWAFAGCLLGIFFINVNQSFRNL